jgi:uncharacterized protein (DUF433 family)
VDDPGGRCAGGGRSLRRAGRGDPADRRLAPSDAPVQRSFRLPGATLERLDRRARERGQSANAVAARLIDEGLRAEDHPLIYFRDGALGRRPALIGSRVDVWQVVDTLRAHDGAIDATAGYLEQPEVKIRAFLRYYADFTAEVDAFAARAKDAARREEEAHGRLSSPA